jgi:monoamine oxidase
VAEFDYCVVGAGFAGLTAALRLKQAGRSVALLEARDRVGGRTFTVTRDDGHNDGEAMMIVDGKKHRYSGTIPWTMSPWAVANLGGRLNGIDGGSAYYLACFTGGR